MRRIIFELCAETVEACIAAREGGADRVELCSGLSEGGVTPSVGLMRAAVERSGLPVHVLIRPRGGDFVYTEREMDVMRSDIAYAKTVGAAGVVLGVLTPEGCVDVAATRELVELARPLEVTFHRAFDGTASLGEAFEEVMATGVDRLLTSGGREDVEAGVEMLADLVRRAEGRIAVAVGGGLRLENAASVAEGTGATHFHGSVRRRVAVRARKSAADPGMVLPGPRYAVDAADVRAMIRRLQGD